jgi:hypothetical protein
MTRPCIRTRILPICGLLAIGCAQIEETTSLRVQPLEPERIVRIETGHGLGVVGQRQGPALQAQVFDVTWCALEHHRRARGFRRIERTAVGHSLLLEWVFGGLFTASGATVFAINALDPPDPATSLRTQTSGYVFAGAVGAIGLSLLTGALVQQASLGKSETDLGERDMEKRDREFQCKREPAKGGRVRLTLADGLQIEGDADGQGQVILPLPMDIDAHLGEGRRATLEAVGDPRAQIRIPL